MNYFPHSHDIYLQKNGVKIAVVCSYQWRTSSNTVFIDGVYLTDDAIKTDVDIASVYGFDLVIEKYDSVVTYRNCEWKTCCFTRSHSQFFGTVRFEESDEVRR